MPEHHCAEPRLRELFDDGFAFEDAMAVLEDELAMVWKAWIANEFPAPEHGEV